MKKNIKNSVKASMLTAIILAAGFPAFSYAGTYAYVNQSGQMSTVVADNGASAIANALGISAHSGVMLVDNSIVPNFPNTYYGARTYAYVNQAGIVVAISADSSLDALANASGIDENSGVVLLSNTSGNNGIVGDQVSGM